VLPSLTLSLVKVLRGDGHFFFYSLFFSGGLSGLRFTPFLIRVPGLSSACGVFSFLPDQCQPSPPSHHRFPFRSRIPFFGSGCRVFCLDGGSALILSLLVIRFMFYDALVFTNPLPQRCLIPPPPLDASLTFATQITVRLRLTVWHHRARGFFVILCPHMSFRTLESFFLIEFSPLPLAHFPHP